MRFRKTMMWIMMWIALMGTLILLGCRGPSPVPPPEPPVEVIRMPTPTEPPLPTPAPAGDGAPAGLRLPLDLKRTRGSWFQPLATETYYLPVELRLSRSEMVDTVVIPYRPRPEVRVWVRIPFLRDDGSPSSIERWMMALEAVEQGDEVVLRGVEGVPNVFGNCRRFRVPARFLDADRMEWAGAIFERGERFACDPGEGVPDRLEEEDAVLMDLAFSGSGVWALYGRWSAEKRYEFWMRRPDGVVEPVPLRYAYWNYILEDGSICGAPADPRFDVEVREGGRVVLVGCLPYAATAPQRPERWVSYSKRAVEEILQILMKEGMP